MDEKKFFCDKRRTINKREFKQHIANLNMIWHYGFVHRNEKQI